MTTQKNAGQRKAKKDIDWDNLDMTMMTIVIEATALVLSGELDKKEEKKAPKDVTVLNVDNTENYCRKCGQAILWESIEE